MDRSRHPDDARRQVAALTARVAADESNLADASKRITELQTEVARLNAAAPPTPPADTRKV